MWEENLLYALEELDYCPSGDARELGRLFGRALDLAGDDGWRARTLRAADRGW